jgi:hypothetical protein
MARAHLARDLRRQEEERLCASMSTAAAGGGRATDVLLRFARDVSGSPEFADDFTLVHLVFR